MLIISGRAKVVPIFSRRVSCARWNLAFASAVWLHARARWCQDFRTVSTSSGRDDRAP